jgi:hypothetical protein
MIQDSHLKHYIDSFVGIEPGWSRCLLVTGAGGCRTDFVIGWLSMMMRSVKYIEPWIMNPFNGQSINSQGTQLYHRFLLWNESMPQAPQCIDWLIENYSKDSKQWLIQKTHKPMQDINDLLPSVLRDKTMVLNILSDDDIETATNAVWEFVVKTFVPKNSKNLLQWYEYERSFDNIKQDYHNDEYSLIVSKITDQVIEKKGWVRSSSEFDDIQSQEISYRSLLTPEGKQHLADILEFDITDHGAHVWDRGLLIAETVNEIQNAGRTWYKNDIRSKILKIYPDIARS